MKKAFFPLMVVLCGAVVMGGCIKNTPYVTTISPSMTASIGTYNFIARSVVPATIDTQVFDTSTTLYITGNSADPATPRDKMVLTIQNYKELSGTYSIVMGQANAAYYHGSTISIALGGIVAITKITSNSIIGYYSFSTSDGLAITNGTFNVGKF